MVAGAEAQQRRSAMVQVREHELAACAVAQLDRRSPVSGSISSGCTKPRAPRCMPSCSSHSPQSEMPMSPIPIASVTPAAPPLLQLGAQSRLAAARLAGDQHPDDARARQVDAALAGRLDQVGGVGGREHGSLGPELLDPPEQEPLPYSRRRPGCGGDRSDRTKASAAPATKGPAL